MEIEKTVYFGSFVEWTSEGRDQLINLFRESYHDKDNIPFVGYNPEHHVFSMQTNEPTAIQSFVATLKFFIESTRRKGNTIDILSQELFRPIECTTLSDFELSSLPQAFDHNDDLINVDSNTDDESTDNTSSGGFPSSYWVPRGGNISILPNHTAREIATLTECMLYEEPENHRVRLMNGNIHRALEKLQRLEPLLELSSRHKAGVGSVPDFNLLSFTSQMPGTGVVYVPAKNRPHCDRIMVPPELEHGLDKMTVGEEWLWDQKERKHVKSSNLALTTTQPRIRVKSWTIEAKYTINMYGNPENALPNTPSEDHSAIPAEKAKPPINSPPAQLSKFMPVSDQARLQEWCRNVDTEADPGVAADEPIESEPVDQPIVRRLVDDSDDGEDAPSLPSKSRLIVYDSDDDGEDDVKANQQPTNHESGDMAQHERLKSVLPDRSHPDRQPHQTKPSEERTTAPARQISDIQQSSAPKFAPDDFWKDMPRDEDTQGGVDRGTVDSSPAQGLAQSSLERYPSAMRPRQSFDLEGPGGDVQTYARNPSQVVMANEAQVPFPTKFSPRKDVSNDQSLMSGQMPSSDLDPSYHGPNQRRQKARFLQTNVRQISPEVVHDPPFHSRSKFQSSNSGKSGRRYPMQGSTHNEINHQRPVESWPRADTASNSATGDFQLGRANRAKQRSNDVLVEISENSDSVSKPTRPPPGLEIRCQQYHATEPSSNILDDPLDEIQRPSLKPAHDGSSLGAGNLSTSASDSSGALQPSKFYYTPQTAVSRPNLNAMQDVMLNQLMTARKSQSGGSKKRSLAGEQMAEKIAKHDELSTRRYHNTMNLQAPNPGKSKKSKGGGQAKASTETAAQKAERISKAKAEAFGPLPINPSAVKFAQRNEEPLTKRKQAEGKEAPAGRAAQLLAPEEKACRQLAESLNGKLGAVFSAVRAFSGHLDFEIQIGQILVAPPAGTKPLHMLETEKWTRTFANSGSPPKVIFSSILTNDGADVDGILDMNLRDRRSQKMFDKLKPETDKVVFEFQCIDSAGLKFNIQFETDGSYFLHNGHMTVGKIAIHCPGRVWDACAVVGGISPWKSPSEDLEVAVTELISSIHIKAKEYPTIYFRLPSMNAFTVRDVLLRQVSLHHCLDARFSHMQLKITETKQLYTSSHRWDKHLHISRTQAHDTMAEDQRVYYELSVIDTSINDGFKENRDLEVGELTPETVTGSQLLNVERCRAILELALHVISKIDWVGRNNKGTLARKELEQAARNDALSRKLPSHGLNPNLVRPLGPGYGNAAMRPAIDFRTNVGTGFAASGVGQPIHGVRANTQAQVYEDVYGNRFLLGQGGARIPVIDEGGSNVGRTEIQPHDSASQVNYRAPRVVRGQMPGFEDKGPGFW